MPVYISLLRGINLGPYKRMKMESLRTSAETLGFSSVKTYIQSGNMVFRASRLSTATVSRQLEERIVKDFGFSSAVVSRTRAELEKVIRDNPFLKHSGGEPSRVHVIFLPDAPTPPAVKELERLTHSPDRSCCLEREIYLYLPFGVGRSSLTNNPVERKWLSRATMRNWTTVCALARMASEL
ncbi:MAG: DUF1697 domain-containing protein [Acidobacteria bacterium]|nr:DUF1697 domain-containing protein [Acidobacteriota bacterium]